MSELFKRQWHVWLAGSGLLTLLVVASLAMLQLRAAQREFGERQERLVRGEIVATADTRAEKSVAEEEERNMVPEAAILEPRDLFNPVASAAALGAVQAGAAELDLELLEILFRSQALQYRGRVVLPDGRQVAQINYAKKSFLAGRGMVIAGHLVTAVDQERVVLEKDGQLIRLPYRTIAYSQERLARIKDRRSQQIHEVAKGETIAGFEVLDITDYVVLLSNRVRHLELQKGKVQP